MTAKRRPKSRNQQLQLPAVPGFRFAGVHCGLKPSGAPDLALVSMTPGSAVAGMFTRSTVVGAPVDWCRDRVAKGRAGALIVNSGISNVATGEAGRKVNRQIAEAAAKATGARLNETFTGATGIIGHPIPLAPVRRGISWAVEELSSDGMAAAARAIMTTDTHPKGAFRRFRVNGGTCTLAGIAKGSGMIEPNMATMLAYLFTDAVVSPSFLRAALRRAVGSTLNRLSVDGETSTSDTVLVFASGASKAPALRGPASPGAERFESALVEVCEDLTRQLARDGEGATKLVHVLVRGARSAQQAELAARRIANSMLVKTAVFGGDPNWGRIVQTVGAAGISIRESKAEVKIGRVAVYKNGKPSGAAARKKAEKVLRDEEVTLEINLAAGSHKDHMWTCDLTHDYIRVNAEYTT